MRQEWFYGCLQHGGCVRVTDIVLFLEVLYEKMPRNHNRKRLIPKNIHSSDPSDMKGSGTIRYFFSLLFGERFFAGFFIFSIITAPLLVHAGIFSFLGKLFVSEEYIQAVTEMGVQNVPLLASNYVADPKAGQGGGDITVVGGSALVSVAGPLGSLADVENELNRSTTISIYVVREDDTLSDIAKMFDVTVNTIIWANDIKRGNVIQPGQTLLILPVSGVQYVVKKGDTIASIAKKYKGDADEILAYNDLASSGLAVGQTLLIPNGEIDAPVTTSSGRVVRGGGPAYAGYYLRPIVGGRKSQGLHGYNGVDLASSCGGAVMASANGNVMVARPYGWNGGYGQYVVISHNNGTQTLYAHLNTITVGAGWSVVQGQVIGYIGSTGLSTGCHVHFEVRGAANPF